MRIPLSTLEATVLCKCQDSLEHLPVTYEAQQDGPTSIETVQMRELSLKLFWPSLHLHLTSLDFSRLLRQERYFLVTTRTDRWTVGLIFWGRYNLRLVLHKI
jgi:hypothetical protein